MSLLDKCLWALGLELHPTVHTDVCTIVRDAIAKEKKRAQRWKGAAKQWRAMMLLTREILRAGAIQKNGGAICAYCGHLAADRDAAQLHMRLCAKHPAYHLQLALERVTRERDALLEEQKAWREYEKEHCALVDGLRNLLGEVGKGRL